MVSSAGRPTPRQLQKRREAMAKPWVATLVKYGARANTWLYRRTGGAIGSRWRVGAGLRHPVPILLLDHVGRTSGRHFTTPLVYLVDGPDLVVVASQGGMPSNPQWFHNLVVSPDTHVQVRTEVRRVRARTADPEQRADLWPRLLEVYADFATYQAITDREIPVVVLEPRPA